MLVPNVQPFCPTSLVCCGYMNLAGLHLEIDQRGGKMSIYEKEGGTAQ